jgi:hypothetical protein
MWIPVMKKHMMPPFNWIDSRVSCTSFSRE